MKIAHFIDTPRAGGAERLLEDLVHGCIDAGHETAVLSPQRWLLERIVNAVPTARPQLVGSDAYAASRPLGRALALVQALPRMAAMLRRLGPDVLHVHDGGYPGSDLARIVVIAGGLAAVPRRVLTVYAAPRPRSESSRSLQTVVDRLVWAANQTVISGTDVVAEQLRTMRGVPVVQGPRRIPWGVALPQGADHAPAFRAELGVAADEVLVGMVAATDERQKGHHVLVEALEAMPGIRAIVVGALPSLEVTRQAAAVGLGDRLLALGRVPEIGPVFHAVDLLVTPSITDESLPLVILEAMACGVPVIASRLSGIPEAVDDGVTGYLFDPGDAAGLARALSILAYDPDRRRALGDAARIRWAESFSLRAMARATLSEYRQAPRDVTGNSPH